MSPDEPRSAVTSLVGWQHLIRALLAVAEAEAIDSIDSRCEKRHKFMSRQHGVLAENDLAEMPLV